MFNFIKNVLFGLGGIVSFLIVIAIVTILGGGLWLILSAIGLVTVGVIRFLFWLILFGGGTIAVLWLIGYLMTSKNA